MDNTSIYILSESTISFKESFGFGGMNFKPAANSV